MQGSRFTETGIVAILQEWKRRKKSRRLERLVADRELNLRVLKGPWETRLVTAAEGLSHLASGGRAS